MPTLPWGQQGPSHTPQDCDTSILRLALSSQTHTAWLGSGVTNRRQRKTQGDIILGVQHDALLLVNSGNAVCCRHPSHTIPCFIEAYSTAKLIYGFPLLTSAFCSKFCASFEAVYWFCAPGCRPRSWFCHPPRPADEATARRWSVTLTPGSGNV